MAAAAQASTSGESSGGGVAFPSPAISGRRLAAIDWMRGFVMLIMALDHASLSFNAGRIANDSVYMLDPANPLAVWQPGQELPLVQFLVRWITHLCAPTFLFLSGTSLALSFEKRLQAGASPREIDRHLAIRAAVILGFEGLLSLPVVLAEMGPGVFQVLFAIAASLLLMIPLRRLPTRWLVAVGLGWFALSDLITGGLAPFDGATPNLLVGLFVAPYFAEPLSVLYPCLPWLAMMALGWAFGRYLLGASEEQRERLPRTVALAGLASLAVFALVRGANGYGNLGFVREGNGLAQWLHVNKYPPSLSFAALELGLMAVCLAGFMLLERRLRKPANDLNPVLVFGQTALFFYMLHLTGLGASAFVTMGDMGQGGLPHTFVATVAALVILYPICLGYRRYKRNHPTSFAQYV